MLILYILIAVALLGSVLLLAPAYLKITVEYIDKKQKTVIILKILGIPLKIPAGDIKREEKKAEKDAEGAVEKNHSFDAEKFKRAADGVRSAFGETKGDIFEILSRLKKLVTVDYVILEIRFGLSDAAKTGMANGAVWAAASGALSAADNVLEVKNADLNIVPVFDRECFDLRIFGILKVRPAHIISVALRLVRVINCFVVKIKAEDKD